MHRIAATPGGWDSQTEGVVFIEQTPAPIVLITAADTDIQTLAQAVTQLPPGFPAIRVASLLNLQQQLTIDTYAEDVLEQAQVIILRLLGGRSYWSYGLEVVRELVQRTGATLFVLPGDDRPDPDLITHSTAELAIVTQLWRYLSEGGVGNVANALKFVADACLRSSYHPLPPQAVPMVGEMGRWGDGEVGSRVGILFYRAHYLAGNTKPIEALCQALRDRHLTPVPLFVSSLRDPDVQAEVLDYFQPKDEPSVQVVLNTTSFSIANLSPSPHLPTSPPPQTLWQKLDTPVFQVILSGGTLEQWQSDFRGLSPRDMAINVALPEVDGRIITRAVSFKAAQTWNADLETMVVGYEPVDDRIQFVADLAANWVTLRQTAVGDRKVALILANYPARDGRIANAVGLDTPASCIEILNAMQQAGYAIDHPPQSADELIQQLTTGITNDPEGTNRPVLQSVSAEDYQHYFATLPEGVRSGIEQRWQASSAQAFPIPGIQFGNVFIGIQPARGYEQDSSLNYHAPDLEPPDRYLAFYYWLREKFGAQAIVHVGKHGNLEWLPGKSIALSPDCYPEVALGALPHLYPFIVNDPGEGSQAKRRSQAVILDHLTPPMTRAELYGPMQQLEGLIDEYYEAQNLDPGRLELIRAKITQLILQENLHQDLGIQTEQFDLKTADAQAIATFELSILNSIDGYLCEIKEAQIRDGLHIFGVCPTGRQLRDLVIAIARHPGQGRLGLTRAIAESWGLDFDPLTADPAELWGDRLRSPLAPLRQLPRTHKSSGLSLSPRSPLFLLAAGAKPPYWGTLRGPEVPQYGGLGGECRVLRLRQEMGVNRSLKKGGTGSEVPLTKGDLGGSEAYCDRPSNQWRTVGDAIEAIELHAAELVDQLLSPLPPCPPAPLPDLTWITTHLLPNLRQTTDELTHLLHGLDGRHIPSGASGAPTRGRPEVLPTGRNFYSVDIRALPTETAWDVGRKAAESLVERYTQENGDYPKTLGLSVWGTATMRSGGDDIAEALALMGTRPVWDGSARRVVDFEILPVSVLGRPRVDVTLRISGFFRDAFPNLIDLFDRAVVAVANLDEPEDQNPLAAQVRRETATWIATGLAKAEAGDRSRHRIFGSKPGAYGAGLQGLIESQDWADDSDLARAYINWSSYAYTGQGNGQPAPEAFEQRLNHMQIVLQNQDNREHDLLDSDDYYQFQGGLVAAVRSRQGQNPEIYFGDHSLPENPKIRRLQEEIARVYRSRVVNPKWIAGAMRHGYKGAFEMAATVDFLFAYDATAQCIEDFMYQGVAEAYLFDENVQSFIQQKNPWAQRDMAERLLEANQRGLWQDVDPTTLDRLRALANDAEGTIEQTSLS